MGAIHSSPSLSVVIPTLDAAGSLPATLESLAEGQAFIGEIIVADAGSADTTSSLARQGGARVIATPRGRGPQLAAGAAVATGQFLCFLHADTRLDRGWSTAVRRFMDDPENGDRAGYFAFRLDDDAPSARRLERMVAWRSRVLGLPYGDQGLLLAREYYQRLGGYRPLALMEDVALVRRIGKARLVALAASALTSAARYRRDGYARRALRNLCCLGLYFLGVPPRCIRRLYG